MTKIRRRSGTYGPKHDPYGWDEWDVERNGVQATIHFSGLSSWLEVNGERINEHDIDEIDDDLKSCREPRMAMLDRKFKQAIGFDLHEIMNAYAKYEQRQRELDPYYDCDPYFGGGE